MPSFILIRPTVWPQCNNVTDRTGQDRTAVQQHRANCFTNGCSKTDERIQMQFGTMSQVGPEKHVLDGDAEASMGRSYFGVSDQLKSIVNHRILGVG